MNKVRKMPSDKLGKKIPVEAFHTCGAQRLIQVACHITSMKTSG